jgi:hypothetical protein
LNLSQFQWAVVVFGMILGLSVTRILTSLIAAFRSRAIASPDLVPVLWALCIFFLQLELWWAFADLRSIIKQWNFALFMLFCSSPLLLFFASALILPVHELSAGEDHRAMFQRNGRWALVAISIYFFKSMLDTMYYWKEPLTTSWAILNGVLIVLPMVSVFSPWRMQRAIAVLSFALTVCFIFIDNAIPVPA